MVRKILIGLSALALGILATQQPTIALIFAGVAVAAFLARRTQDEDVDPEAEGEAKKDIIATAAAAFTSPDAELQRVRARSAMDVARRELSLDPAEDSDSPIPLDQTGLSSLRVGYADAVPYVAITHDMGDRTEMTFVIRRPRSMLGLPPIVDNTPLQNAGFEYRLRRMDLGGAVGEQLDGATNRPRLFRELLAAGLLNDLSYALYDSQWRLEDLVYSGKALTLLVQPAVDPTQSAFAMQALMYSQPLVDRIRAFLLQTEISSAQP